MIEKYWDVNIYFEEHWDAETRTTTYSDTLRINPYVYSIGDGISDHTWTDTIIQTTKTETDQIVSHREDLSDWFEDLDGFLEIAPPRIASLLKALPDPYSIG